MDDVPKAIGLSRDEPLATLKLPDPPLEDDVARFVGSAVLGRNDVVGADIRRPREAAVGVQVAGEGAPINV